MKLTRSQQRTVGRSIVFIIAALILAVICTLVSALSVFLSIRLHGFSFPDTYTMKVGMDSTKPNKLKSHSYKIGTFHDKETVYVNFTILRTYCGFYESGDRQELRFILPADGSYFTVKDGSTQVDINGNLIHMDAPAVVSEGQLWLPLAFIDHYVEGITVEHQVDIEKDEDTGEEIKTVHELIYIIRCNEKNEYSFLLQPTAPSLPIDRSEIQ